MWKAATDLKVPVCVHFFRWNRDIGLPALKAVLEDFPQTEVVVDHFSNMVSEAGPPDHGVDALLFDIARFPKVTTKFTTIPLGQLHEKKMDSAAVVQRVVEVFGAQRVMWGSDIAQSRGSYSYMVELAHEAVAKLSDADRKHVLYGTADTIYGAQRKSPRSTRGSRG